MKKIILILVAGLMMSCSSDDDSGSNISIAEAQSNVTVNVQAFTPNYDNSGSVEVDATFEVSNGNSTTIGGLIQFKFVVTTASGVETQSLINYVGCSSIPSNSSCTVNVNDLVLSNPSGIITNITYTELKYNVTSVD